MEVAAHLNRPPFSVNHVNKSRDQQSSINNDSKIQDL